MFICVNFGTQIIKTKNSVSHQFEYYKRPIKTDFMLDFQNELNFQMKSKINFYLRRGLCTTKQQSVASHIDPC